MNALNRLLTTLSQAPPDQIDGAIVTRLRGLIGCPREVVVAELQEIYAQCVTDGLATDFAVKIIGETVHVAETQR